MPGLRKQNVLPQAVSADGAGSGGSGVGVAMLKGSPQHRKWDAVEAKQLQAPCCCCAMWWSCEARGEKKI